MANDKTKDDGKAPQNIPQGDIQSPGVKGEQNLSTSATPNTPAGPPGMAAGQTNPDAPRGKQWYRVKAGTGSVKFNGVLYQEGMTLQAAAADAMSIDNYLEVLDGPPDAPNS